MTTSRTPRASLSSRLPLCALVLCLPLLACGEGEVTEEESADELATSAALSKKADLGRRIFNDSTLSVPAGQSCASCHNPARAFTDGRATSPGAVAGRAGFRNTPSINYASFITGLSAAGDETGYAGGLFLDGRAATLEDQAKGPLLNPLEMNNPDKASVINKIRQGSYATLFRQVFGSAVFNNTDTAFDKLAEAVATYERTGISNRFTSKYDAFLAGKVTLSAAEQRGLALFEDPAKGNCAVCHISRPAAGKAPLFSDFGYDNVGVPRSATSAFYQLPAPLNPDGPAFIDHGLSASIHNPRQDGKFRAPSLRNVAVTAPYMHNGYFADLRSVVQFYNTRDVATWPAPEVSFHVNTATMGNLHLTNQEVDDLVTFMGTLTDGYK